MEHRVYFNLGSRTNPRISLFFFYFYENTIGNIECFRDENSAVIRFRLITRHEVAFGKIICTPDRARGPAGAKPLSRFRQLRRERTVTRIVGKRKKKIVYRARAR